MGLSKIKLETILHTKQLQLDIIEESLDVIEIPRVEEKCEIELKAQISLLQYLISEYDE